jgi:hypothetical protein
MPLKSLPFLAFDLPRRLLKRMRMYALRPLFGSYGRNFRFDPDGSYTFQNIHVGNDVNLGLRPVLIAALSEIRIGNHVMFGPEVMVIGGGHNSTVPGQFMINVHEKTGNEDLGGGYSRRCLGWRAICHFAGRARWQRFCDRGWFGGDKVSTALCDCCR